MSKRRLDFQIERLELDIDCRLLDLWGEAGEVKEWDLCTVSAFLRAAYGRGFTDATEDPNPERFFREHGYKPPKRRRK